MPTECSAECFDFGIVEDRLVEAAFDGGLVTSDAGALLLGATDRAIGMIDRFAGCALQAHVTQPPGKAAAATLSQQSRIESCVVSGDGHCEA